MIAASLRNYLPIVLFVILIRGLVSIAAMAGANLLQLPADVQRGAFGVDPRFVPGVWVRFDSGYYLGIAANGYSYQGQELAFFPLYPLLVRAVAIVGGPVLLVWAGFVVSNIAYLLGTLVLWRLLKNDHGTAIAWGTAVSLAVFPTSLFFSAVYTESLFFLLSVLVYVLSVRKRFAAAGIVVSLASLTRVTGLLLAIIPLVELVQDRRTRSVRRVCITGFLSSVGLAGYMWYLWVFHGSPFAFVAAQSYWKKTIVWPWQSVADSLGVVANGLGGFQTNWFMRVVSAEDLMAALLFLACTGVGLFVLRPSLSLYATAAIVLLLVDHGPYTFGLWSMSRYVLGLFPCFIVMAIVLSKARQLRLAAWGVSSVLMLFLAAWFGGGRWVA